MPLRGDDMEKNDARTINEDLQKCYVITLPDAHMVEQRSDKQLYLPLYPVIVPNKPEKVRRVLNGAAKSHGTFLNKSCTMQCNATQRTARDSIGQYPEATKAVLENFYIDNYIDSVESLERALNRSKELVHLLHLGGFKLHRSPLNQK